MHEPGQTQNKPVARPVSFFFFFHSLTQSSLTDSFGQCVYNSHTESGSSTIAPVCIWSARIAELTPTARTSVVSLVSSFASSFHNITLRFGHVVGFIVLIHVRWTGLYTLCYTYIWWVTERGHTIYKPLTHIIIKSSNFNKYTLSELGRAPRQNFDLQFWILTPLQIDCNRSVLVT